MRNKLSSVCSITLLLVAFIIISFPFYDVVNASTTISGVISTDTTWTKANSPYTCTGPVAINVGATLKIEPGVIVNLAGYDLQVNGTLLARGLDIDKIALINGAIKFTSLSTPWNETTATGCIIEHSIMNSTSIVLGIQNSSPKIVNNTIFSKATDGWYSAVEVSVGSPLILNNSISSTFGALVLAGSSSLVYNNTLYSTGSSGNGIDMHYDNSTIIGNLILNVKQGIYLHSSDRAKPVIMNNSILNAYQGIFFVDSPHPMIKILLNNIQSNLPYNCYTESSSDLNMTYNWWGTTDVQAINQTIYDYKNNYNSGKVTFVPFLMAPNTAAPTYTNALASINGAISPRGITRLNCGENQTFTITANNGYYISDVLVNGTSFGPASSLNIQNVTGATTVQAFFAPFPQTSGVIISDTTWTSANNPYNLTGNLLLKQGVKLTIAPGVVVNLNGYYIMINGTLQALGSGANPITFNSGEIIFTESSSNWNESTLTGCIIANSTITSDISIDGGAPCISRNTITGFTNVDGGNPIIINNNILGQGLRLGLWSKNSQVIENTIAGCSNGIEIIVDNSTAIIQGNLIINNTNGIQLGAWFPPNGYPIIRNNTITKNNIGIILGALSDHFSPTIIYNNIFDNNINMQTTLQINTTATFNWWGTTNTSVISQFIYDYSDDFTLGVINFDPMLTAFNTAAPTYVNATATVGGSISPNGITKYNYLDSQTYIITANTGYHIADVKVNGTLSGLTGNYLLWQITGPTNITAVFAADPTPTPTPTSQPSSNPTSNPTTNPTQSPTSQPSPSPTVPEYPSIALIAILLAAASGAILFYRRSTYKRT